MFYETRDNRHGLAHDPFKALVAPRPIGWISTRSTSGAVNLAPYSFFNAISDVPKLVMFSSSGGEKDSAHFAVESGEFVVNIATVELADAMNATSAPAPRGESEFDLAGLEAAPCHLVKAPRVARAPAALECLTTDSFRPKGADGRESTSVVVIGEVVAIHIDDALITDGRVAMDRLRLLSRLGYRDYAVVEEVFELVRPG